ncbi:DUF3951 domain-containing protein [Bacillus sp. KH172YL63]|uniref:DUF3951 domain-containing protein n=1 Tax=Bacillus sp. KH172YL63 TaxID=2709784 RepID=UPI001564710C|nr:DUF3951 domain-containing protein [Bacillus sp. KH172YL63]
MNGINMFAVGFPLAITLLVLIGFYKVFIKKKSISLFYTPFDQVTGQTEVSFHEEQEIIAEDEDQGEGNK